MSITDNEREFHKFLDWFIPFVLITMVCFFVLGRWWQRSNMRAEAITAGVAHWEIDATTGEATFLYNTPVEKKP